LRGERIEEKNRIIYFSGKKEKRERLTVESKVRIQKVK